MAFSCLPGLTGPVNSNTKTGPVFGGQVTRYFLNDGVQERFNQARFDAISTMARIAKDEQCQFVVVCGDAFESNQVDPKTVARALEAMREFTVPVYILPANHDPLNEASVYRLNNFMERKSPNIHIIEDSTPIRINEKVELVGAPWFSKRPAINPLIDMLGALSPTDAVTRICLAHGGIDIYTPKPDEPGIIALDMLRQALTEAKVHFIALGDRHSLTSVGNHPFIWYSGTPEVTDFREIDSGFVNLVEIADDRTISTRGIPVGQWKFIEFERFDLNNAEDLAQLQQSLNEIENKALTVLKLNFVGTLTLTLNSDLQVIIATAKDLYGALEVTEHDLLVLPDDADFSDLGFSGFAETTVQKLRDLIAEDSNQSTVARDALMLMLRLAKGELA